MVDQTDSLFTNRLRRPGRIDTGAAEAEHLARTQNSKSNGKNNESNTPQTAASTPGSNTTHHAGIRNRTDIRSPGIENSPQSEDGAQNDQFSDETELPDFMTQTDKYGNAVTPRPSKSTRPTSPQITVMDKESDNTGGDRLLESLRMMCCCLLPEPDVSNSDNDNQDLPEASTSSSLSSNVQPMRKKESIPHRRQPQAVFPAHAAGRNVNLVDESERHRIKLLPRQHPDDAGQKCLVLDLDETLVHSSFRAVAGADFVIPVQIEDVVHFVYVSKRPGVDKFLIEMAKHYEIVIYTASLNKYADPLLDLLDPKKTIRHRIFRESCVYYEGNYVKDLSLIDRDLSQSIIVDNSPASYIFHPANAIDCGSYIDDPRDRELDQIGKFLKGVKNVKDVRSLCGFWRDWPSIPPKLAESEHLNLTESMSYGCNVDSNGVVVVQEETEGDNIVTVDLRDDRHDHNPR